MALAENIRRIRLGAGMTQLQFAMELGINPQTVSKWERGVLKPSAKMKQAMRGIEAGSVDLAEEQR